MANDIDPDLKSMLDELTKAEGALNEAATEPPVPEVAPQEPVAPITPELPKNEDLVESLKEVPPAADEEATPAYIEPATLEIETELDEDPRSAKIKDDVVKLLAGYVASSGQMLEEFEVDRKKCDDLYNILIAKIQSGTYSGSDATAVVMLLQAKSEISGNRSRHMDSISKLLGAVKANPVVGTGDKGGGGGGSGDEDQVPSRSEVLRLLERPVE